MGKVISLIDYQIYRMRKIIAKQRKESEKSYQEYIRHLDKVLEQIRKDKEV